MTAHRKVAIVTIVGVPTLGAIVLGGLLQDARNDLAVTRTRLITSQSTLADARANGEHLARRNADLASKITRLDRQVANYQTCLTGVVDTALAMGDDDPFTAYDSIISVKAICATAIDPV